MSNRGNTKTLKSNTRAATARANRNSWRTVSRKNLTKSGHISTDAKVGNINSYVSYAATNNVPYLLSTNSRYNALLANTKQIVDRVSSELHNKSDKALDLIYEKVKKQEEKFLKGSELAKQFKTDSSNGIADKLNELSSEKGNVSKIVTKMTSDIREASYAFMDKFTESKVFLEQIPDAIGVTDTPLDWRKAKSGSVLETNYRIQDLTRIEEIYQSMLDFLTIVDNSEELKAIDLITLSRAITFTTVTALRMKAEPGKLGLFDNELEVLMGKTRSIVKKFSDQNKQIRAMNNIYGEGSIGEVVFLQVMNEVLQAKYELEADPVEIERQLMLSLVSGGKDKINKSADYVITYPSAARSKQAGVDYKTIGPVKQRTHGLIYQTKIDIDYVDSMMDLVTGTQLSPSTQRLYRSLMLNRAVEGYTFKPEEREFLIFNFLNNQERFDHKFFVDDDKADLEGYPIFVAVNGIYLPFSEVIKNMGTPQAILGPSTGVQLSAATGIKNNLSLYKEKVDVGRKLEADTKTRKVKGFAAKVPRAVDAARIIESQYNRKSYGALFGIKRIR